MLCVVYCVAPTAEAAGGRPRGVIAWPRYTGHPYGSFLYSLAVRPVTFLKMREK